MKRTPRPIRELAESMGIAAERFVPYGTDKGKILPDAARNGGPRGRLILVSAITPTSAGEGKTTTSIGLAQGLALEGKKVCLALREPSLGPIFGVKGGATGGGRSTLLPAEEINLHFTGDFHAITAAHNLLAAMLDNHLHQGNKLDIDSRKVFFRRVMDMNDRSLRNVVVGLGGADGVPRESGFDITAASEVMAILCLAEDEHDLRKRLSRMIVAQNTAKEPITAADLKAVGAMMALLKDALHPNLVQTEEGVPALLHGGPFANIAHGCNSVIATKTALAHADWVVTEAGFGFDLGGEKFFDIKCVSAGLDPAAVVLVATIRALKRHGGVKKRELNQIDPAAVERGLCNLEKQVENIRVFSKTPIVALNRFGGDDESEIEIVRTACARMETPFAVSNHFADGGAGAVELARTVVRCAEAASEPMTPVYDWKEPIQDKMSKVALKIYGARIVVYSEAAKSDMRRIERLGFSKFPLCVAKTQMSLSDDPLLAGRPKDFRIFVQRLLLSAGAGFIVPVLGAMVRMPGLPPSPQAERIDMEGGQIRGLMAD